jgi:hypothetical protein
MFRAQHHPQLQYALPVKLNMVLKLRQRYQWFIRFCCWFYCWFYLACAAWPFKEQERRQPGHASGRP